MGAILTDTTAKIRAMEPNAATKWSDTFIRSFVHAADLMIKEECETLYDYQDITLVADTHSYDLSTNTVAVDYVEWLSDGSNVDGRIDPTTYRELDLWSPSWEDETRDKPTHYLLLSTPGISSQAKIRFYPYLASVTAEVCRVHYVKVYATIGTQFIAQQARRDEVDQLYTPLTLSMMLGATDPALAAEYLAQYRRALGRFKSRYKNLYGAGRGTRRDGGVEIV